MRAWPNGAGGRSSLGTVKEALAFRLRRPNWDDLLTEDLPFGEDAESRFRDLVGNSQSYLEFGSGASTLFAAQNVGEVTTVESDPRFLDAVVRRAQSLVSSSRLDHLNFLNGNIGGTGPWGKPIWPSIARPHRWSRYPLAPWDAMGADLRPDVVLVDGRFRVACALALITRQPEGQWTLLVDDYSERPEYGPIAEFAQLEGLHGRMAEFHPKKDAGTDSAAKALAHFLSDWR